MKNKSYFPSNGTEGMIFTSLNCDHCYKEKQCTILINSVVLGKEPKQWIYDENDNPICTSFRANRPKKKKKPTIGGPTLF